MIVATVQRHILLFVLGIWSGASVFMWLVATQNFAVAKALQEAPVEGFVQTTSGLDAEAERVLGQLEPGWASRSGV